MAHLIRFLMQDHARINRALEAYAQAPSNLDLALTACGELEIHSTIEEEVLYPVIRDELDAGVADAGQEEHAQVQELIDTVSEMEPGDADLPAVMHDLMQAFAAHVDHEESSVFPALQKILLTRVWDLGREAFTIRQEMLEDGSRPTSQHKAIANAGWAKGSVANSGW
jgi:hemerythrin-like domain-containing protein